MKIAKALKSSKRLKSTIKIETKKTRVILTYNNLILNFSKIEAREIGENLTKSVMIQRTVKYERLADE